MKNIKICVYTCITGNYDNLKEIDKSIYEKNIDYYCFTNNKNITSDTWKVIYVSDENLDNHLLSRKIKILGHEIINKNYDISVWMDGSISLKCKISQFLNDECDLENNDLVCFKHSVRNCIYEEAKACIQLMKDDPEVIKKQVKFLEKEKFPKDYGLGEMGFFVRKIKSDLVIKTMGLWYSMLQKYSKRDQLSFMYSAYKTKIKFQMIDLSIYDNKYFEVINHNNIYEIKKYRVSFVGTNKQNDDSLDYIYKYEIDNNKYKASFKIVKDTNVINFQISNIGGILINNISYSFDAKMKLKNIYKINEKYLVFNELGIIEFRGMFNKDGLIEITLDMERFDQFFSNTTMKSFYENDINQTKYIKTLEKKNRELMRRIRLKNKDYNDINSIYNSMVDKCNNLEKEYYLFEKKYEELEKKYKLVINSKGWQMLEKLRKLKNK